MALVKSEYGFFNDYTGSLAALTETYKMGIDVGNKIREDNHSIKADAGKPRLSLVPSEIIRDIARVREYGVKKYGTSESWREVEPERYRDAMYRHLLAYIENPKGVDEESGLPHLWHLACNIAFLCELEKNEINNSER